MTQQEKDADRRLLKEVMQLSKAAEAPAPRVSNLGILPDIHRPGV
jgi:hypothetical protein